MTAQGGLTWMHTSCERASLHRHTLGRKAKVNTHSLASSSWETQRPGKARGRCPLRTQPAGEMTPPFPPHQLPHSHLPLSCAQQSSAFDTRLITVIRYFIAWGRLKQSFWRAFWPSLSQICIPFHSAISSLRIYPRVCVCMCMCCLCKDVHCCTVCNHKKRGLLNVCWFKEWSS